MIIQNINDFLAELYHLNHPLLSGFSALLVLLMGIFVFLKDRKSKLYRTFLWLTIAVAGWFLGTALAMFYADNFKTALFWFMFGYTFVPFICVTYYHFYLVYLNKKQKILYFFYTLAALETFYFLFSSSLEMDNMNVGIYFLPNVGAINSDFKTGAFYLMFFGVVKYILLSALTALSFRKEYKREADLSKKRQLKLLTIIFFVAASGAMDWLPTFNIQIHIGWLVLLIFVSALAYAILKYQLMDIKIIIKKAIFYSLGIGLVSGVITGITFLNSWLLENISGFQFLITSLIVGIVAFAVGNLFYQKSKQLEKAYQLEKESRVALEEMRNVLEIRVEARTRELKELAEGLEEKVKERTKELQERIKELEKFHRLAVGRELKMIELKEEIEKLKKSKLI